jgi:hypothetical protein
MNCVKIGVVFFTPRAKMMFVIVISKFDDTIALKLVNK